MKYLIIALLLNLFALTAHAEQSAYTVHNTEIKQQPYSDADTVATLPEKSAVTILTRQGGWVRIGSSQGSGWVKMLSLRGSNTATKSGDSGLQSLFNIGRTGSSGITVATGVRGLSEEDLKNTSPNPGELRKLHGYAADRVQAEKFARDAKLKSQTFDYLPDDGNS